MTVSEAIKKCDFEKLYNRLNAYAYSRLNSINFKDFDGIEPEDFVSEIIIKSLKGIRNWNSNEYSFEEFMFGSLKSDIDAFFKRKKRNLSSSAAAYIQINDNEYIEDIRERILKLLRNENAKEDELKMFEILCEGITKRSEISKELELQEKEVDNIRKRLFRKLQNVRKLIVLS